MVIEYNTDLITEITPDQFIIAQLYYDRRLDIIKHFRKKLGDNFQVAVANLISAEYLKEENGDYYVTPKFISEMRNEGMFEELLALFPTSVIRPDGTKDYLRAGHARCKIKYNAIIKKSKPRHDLILKCLQLELKTRKNENKLGYMKRLSNWISTAEWEAWEPRLEDESINENQSNYGESLE